MGLALEFTDPGGFQLVNDNLGGDPSIWTREWMTDTFY